jgi:hypothetical protein
MTDEQTARGGIEGYPTGLSWYQHHRVARVVASASSDATDCALLLAALGVHPGDGLQASSPGTTADPALPAPRTDAAGVGTARAESGIRRKRSGARWTRD